MELSKLKISSKKIEILSNMNIHNVEDLISYYPFRYEIIERIPFIQWKKDDKIAVEGVISSRARVLRIRNNMSITKFKITNDENEFDISIFNQPWISNFKANRMITIIGKYEGGNRITSIQYNFKPLKEQIGFQSIYNLKDGITQNDLKKYIKKAMELKNLDIETFIPLKYKEKYRLIDKLQALYYIHFPKDKESLRQAIRYLKYEEFLKFQIHMQYLRMLNKEEKTSFKKIFEKSDVYELERQLSFSLTDGQKKVIEDILNDLKSTYGMYRMLQGDVGCGKTMVAAFCMYACVLSHYQAAFMAPTEILAKQHAKNLKKLFLGMGIRVECLYSSLKTRDKEEILKDLRDNRIDILVGTHALFQDDVTFSNLGFVVADEQHRFGVEQRKRLIEKGSNVDFLFMSATPIPRTLALSLYGDMDVSTIEELPKGRMPITTKLIKSNSMQSILVDVLKKIDEGNQCYIVCPAIENNEEYQIRNVNDIYKSMNEVLGKKYHIGLLHGKMSANEKDEVMEQFLAHQIDILVSTTVIEVGVDVENANIMIIYDAHRFGMSQIHQLRGRVGRGNLPGYCYLLTSTKDIDSLHRLEVCEKTTNGFEIAKEDLAMRGPGDILGTRQSGIPSFVLGDVIADNNILEIARDDAIEIMREIDKKENECIKKYINLKLSKQTYID